ncbi:MAG: MATE family efflux transporter [Candidatus Lambdaproteobacteria bacterium]|nr:MATE family efflux transporter [Candidatus Lambdaproteobacteria bacterium]
MSDTPPSADLSRPPTRRELLRFAVPLMAGMITFGLHGVIDAAFIGRLGTPQLAGLGMANAYYVTILVLLLGVMRNAVAFTGRAFGAGRPQEIGPLLVQYQWLALAGLPLAWAAALGFPGLARAAGLTHQVVEHGTIYLFIRVWETPCVLLTILYATYHQSKGNSRLPMLVNWLMLPLNVVLDYLLIFGKGGFPALGLAGGALATVLANLSGAALIVTVSHLRRAARAERLRILGRPQRAMLREILRVSLPMGLGDFLEMCNFLVFYAIVGRLGTTALAAGNLALQVTHLIFLPGFAVGIAASSYMGRYLGAGSPALARTATLRALGLGVIYMGLAGIPLWFLGERIAAGFVTEREAIVGAGLVFKVMAVYQVFDAVGMILRSALGGAGDTRVPTAALPLCALGVMFPAALLLSEWAGLGLLGAFLGEALYIVVLAGVLWWRFERGPWRNMTLRTA